MNRRSFLNLAVSGVATAAAVRTWPFRVFSFPSKPVAVPLIAQYQQSFPVTSTDLALSLDEFSKRFLQPAIDSFARQIDFDSAYYIDA
jgi:hypothetical protein